MSDRPKILVCEDHVQIRRLVKMMLRPFPVDIVEAGSAAEAVAAFDQHQPAMAFLDRMLPDGDGLEVCRAIKSRRPETHVVMLSARGQTTDREMAAEAGADGYVVKPFEEKELHAAVRVALPGLGAA